MKNILTVILMMFGLCTMAEAQLIKEKEPVDPKYLAGAVPMVGDSVVFSQTMPIPANIQISTDSLFKILARFIARNLNEEGVLKRSGLVNDVQTHHLEVGVVEYITFKSKAFVLDRTQIIYKLTVDLSDGKVNIKMSNISYYYNEDSTPEKFSAEEWISDKTALNRKKDGFVYRHGKFRMKTVDLFERNCSDIAHFLGTL